MSHRPGCLAALFPLLRLLLWAPFARRFLPKRTITVLSDIKLTLDREFSTWEGQITLPAWAGYQSRNACYNSADSDSPTDGTFQISINTDDGSLFSSPRPSPQSLQALQFFIQHQHAIHDHLASHLLRLSWNMRKNDSQVPLLKDPQQLKKYIGPSILHVYLCQGDPQPCIGLELGCQWEEEHGLGVVTQNGKIVAIGQADTAFSGPDPDSLKHLGR